MSGPPIPAALWKVPIQQGARFFACQDEACRLLEASRSSFATTSLLPSPLVAACHGGHKNAHSRSSPNMNLENGTWKMPKLCILGHATQTTSLQKKTAHNRPLWTTSLHSNTRRPPFR